MSEDSKTLPVLEDDVKWHFFNLYCLAIADEEFDITERKTLYEIGIEYGITPKQISEVVMTTNINNIIPDSLDKKVEYLFDLVRMALADGKILEKEKEIIKKCAVHYGFEPQNVQSIVDYLFACAKEGKNKDSILKEINE